jgi:aspartyl-tRNA(Asn)/glutamyl-tRNA(Gln) amidotransferase subunit A
MKLHTLSVHQLCELMEKKEVSSEELTKACLERVDKVENDIRAFITIAKEEALTQARAVDEKRMQGEVLNPLAGIPMAVSDNICTKGIKTTCASEMLNNYVSPYDASAVERLKEAGTVLLGKCNMDEFSMGSSTENSRFFCTRNPIDLNTVPGGSCGGSAAAAAAGEAVFTLGSDTGGSVRQPASFCGVIGFKPTYGRISRYGLISSASSLDQIGTFTRDMRDLALVLNVVCGHDIKDSTSSAEDVPDFTSYLISDVKGLRIGLPKEFFTGLPHETAAKLKEAALKLEESGAVCEEIALPHTEYALPAHYIISCAEASSNLARYDGVRYGLRVEAEDVLSMFRKTRSKGFGTEVKRRIMLGTHTLSTGCYDAYYLKALKVRSLIRQDFDRVFDKFDCILTPSVPGTAFKVGEKADNPLEMYMSHAFTLPVNLSGLPAMSLPFGAVKGLPVGLQLIAPHNKEGTLLRVGYTLEQSSDQTRQTAGLAR